MEDGGIDHEELQSRKVIGGVNEAASQKCAQQPCAKRAGEESNPARGGGGGVLQGCSCGSLLGARSLLPPLWNRGLLLTCLLHMHKCAWPVGLAGSDAAFLREVVVITATDHRTVLSPWRVQADTGRRMWQAVAQMEWLPGQRGMQGGEWLPMQNP